MKHKASPYLEVVDEPRQMRGEGAPRSTAFGVIGRTKETGKMKTLGGLVEKPPTESAKFPSDNQVPLHKNILLHTERGITGPASHTHISKEHYAQIPYPGAYFAKAGDRL